MPGSCRDCGLWQFSRAVKVWGEGPASASMLLLGEALGAEEEQEARPFVGKAGHILNQALASAGIPRHTVYIGNSVKCRPTNAMGNNRVPTAHELRCCRGFLDDEVSTLPSLKVIVALGASAAWSALAPHHPTGGVLENQGRVVWSERYLAWVVCTVHPSYVGRKPAEMEGFVLDLLKAKHISEHGHPQEPKRPRFEVVQTLDQAASMRDALLASDLIWWDWETDGVHLTRSIGFCVAFSCSRDPEFAWVVPRYGSDFMPTWRRDDLSALDEILRSVFRSPVPKGGHHVGFDACITETTLGVWPENITEDTQVADHLVHNHLGERAHGLKRLAERMTPYGRYDSDLDAWLLKHGFVESGKPDMAYLYKVPSELTYPYIACDVIVPALCHPRLLDRIRAEGLEQVYRDERMPFALLCARMDRQGVRIDTERLGKLGQDLSDAKAGIEAEISRLAGRPLNPSSTNQLVEYFYTQDLGLPIRHVTETGRPSTSEEALLEFSDHHPVASLVLHHRVLGKYKSTFVDGSGRNPGGLAAAVDRDGRARMNTLLCATETFRLVTRRPFPLHVIPRPLVLWSCGVHGDYRFERCCDEGHPAPLNIRSLVIPDDGYVFLEADWRAQEFCLAAIISGQKDWEEAILDGGADPHEYVMQRLAGRSKQEFGAIVEGKFVFHSPEHEYEYKNLRSTYKSVNFMILYGGGEKKLSRMLSTRGDPGRGIAPRIVTQDDAARMIQEYYEVFNEVRWWRYKVCKELYETGRVRTPFGTYRVLPGVHSPELSDRLEAERMACNAPIQMSGYHVMARGALALDQHWRKRAFPGRLVFTRHDEIVAQVRRDLVEEGMADVRTCLSRPHRELVGGCGIPRGLPVDIHVTDAWGKV